MFDPFVAKTRMTEEKEGGEEEDEEIIADEDLAQLNYVGYTGGPVEHLRDTIKRNKWDDGVKKMSREIQRDNIVTINIEEENRRRKVCDAIKRMTDLIPGFIVDITANDPEDGRPWDFACQDKREKACLLYTSDAADD